MKQIGFVPVNRGGGMKKLNTPIGEGLVYFQYYGNYRIRIQVIDAKEGTSLYVATVNLPEEICPEGYVWIKSWSENQGIDGALMDAGIISERVMDTAARDARATLHQLLVDDVGKWNAEVRRYQDSVHRDSRGRSARSWADRVSGEDSTKARE